MTKSLKLPTLKTLSLLLFVLFTFLYSNIYSQSVSGEWYGVGHIKKSGAYNSYLSEMVLKQKGNKVTGVFKYFYRNDSIKVRVSGTYLAQYRRLELKASPILNFQAKNTNGADCPMEGGFNLKITPLETTLTGQFNPTYDYRIVCPAIDIRFVKYNPAKKEKPVIQDEPEDTAKPVTVVDTTSRTIAAPKPLTPNDLYIRELYKRTFEAVGPVIEVDADSLVVNFYDNGEIDNDTISVFYNRKPVVVNQMLSKQPVTVRLKLDTAINEISMFANNLGTISPNTAVAVIYAGEQRLELGLTSSLLTNATIRFRKKEKNKDPKNIN